MKLIPHPAFPPRSIEAVDVELVIEPGDDILLCYRVRGSGAPSLPDLFSPGRANDLWKTTCFELFLQPAESPGYLEFNFSPSTRWSAYAFDGHRQGRRDFPLTVEPIIEREPALEPDEANVIYALNAEVDLSDIPNVPHLMGVCAVIEETDGTISYWALAHPPGKPDFHDPACFALVLPAA